MTNKPWVVVPSDGNWLRGIKLSRESRPVNFQGVKKLIRHLKMEYHWKKIIIRNTCDEARADLESDEEPLEDDEEV